MKHRVLQVHCVVSRRISAQVDHAGEEAEQFLVAASDRRRRNHDRLHDAIRVDDEAAAVVQELRERARNVLLTEAIVAEEQIGEVSEDMLNLDGMDKQLAGKLAMHGVKNRDDLADLAIDELIEMTGIEADRAKQLITTARAHWFE